jgi:hypothetical protein
VETPAPKRRATSNDDDDEPFALGSAFAAELAGLAGGEHARLGAEADRTRRFRLKVEAWAKSRDLAVVDGVIRAAIDEAVVTVPLYSMTEETAVVHAESTAPARVSITVEPTSKGWVSSLLGRFGAKNAGTGDATFDAAFTVRASDEAARQQLLGETAREALLAMDAWCRLTYENGHIEVRLDSARLAGGHVMRAIEIAGAMARERVHTAAYR